MVIQGYFSLPAFNFPSKMLHIEKCVTTVLQSEKRLKPPLYNMTKMQVLQSLWTLYYFISREQLNENIFEKNCACLDC